jgi:hypothetical protein
LIPLALFAVYATPADPLRCHHAGITVGDRRRDALVVSEEQWRVVRAIIVRARADEVGELLSDTKYLVCKSMTAGYDMGWGEYKVEKRYLFARFAHAQFSQENGGFSTAGEADRTYGFLRCSLFYPERSKVVRTAPDTWAVSGCVDSQGRPIACSYVQFSCEGGRLKIAKIASIVEVG